MSAEDPPTSSRPPVAFEDTTPAALGDTLLGTQSPAAALSPGALLGGRYRLVRRLGQGGMGAVWLAHDATLGHDVALKFVRRELAGAIERLRAEVLLAQKVTHPGVCKTYDLEELGGELVMKMEYVAGETLAERLGRKGRMEVGEAVALGREIATALDAAHARGVVHCDLKPQNVLLEEGTGRVVLMDFGLARVTQAASEEGPSGTPAYMSPEQARGLALDGRTDLYALGCVMYQMLVGETPFRGETAGEVIQRQVEDAAPELRGRRPESPRWLGRLVGRLLEKDPGRRPTDARAVIEALETPARRRRRVVGVAAGVVLAGAVAMVAVIGTRQVTSGEAWRPVMEERSAYDESSSGGAISPDGRWLAYDTNRDGRVRVYVEPMAGGPAHPVTPADMRAENPRWTRDGALLFECDADAICRMPLRDGKPTSPPQRITSGMSPEDCNGILVLARAGAPDCPLCWRLLARDPDGTERELARGPTDGTPILHPRCDGAGMRAVFTWGGSEWKDSSADLAIVPLSGGKVMSLTSDHQGNLHPTFAPDGQSVIFSSRRGGVIAFWEIAAAGGQPRQLTFDAGGDVLQADVSADGRFLVFGRSQMSRSLFSFSLKARARQIVTRSLDDSVWRAAPTADGEVVLDVTRKGKHYIVVRGLEGGAERTLCEGRLIDLTRDGSEAFVAINPDDRQDRARILAVSRRGGASRVVTEAEGFVGGGCHAADGDLHFAAVQKDSSMSTAWRVPSGGGKAEVAAPPPWALVCPAPSGGWRYAARVDGGKVQGHLLPPGVPLDGQGQLLPAGCWRQGWDHDGTSLLYQCGVQVRRRWVREARDEVLFEEDDSSLKAALAPDGDTVLFSRYVVRTRRAVITNFASRPRP